MNREQRRTLAQQITSAITHAAFAVLFQVGVAATTGNWLAGSIGGVMFFLGREVAQREYKLTKGGSVKGLAPWAGFDLVEWGRDGLLDLAFPVVAVVAVLTLAPQPLACVRDVAQAARQGDGRGYPMPAPPARVLARPARSETVPL